MSIKWITPAGNLGVFTERVPINIVLDAVSDDNLPIEYSVISGKLPRGVRLIDGFLRGSPSEVRRFTVSRFVIRAATDNIVEDRTFSISIDGADEPKWITQEGFLQAGAGQAFFVLDNAKVDVQLEATDPDEIAGDTLEYFLVPRGGELPPGLSLSKDGRIFGFTDPIFALEYGTITTGGYDLTPYDNTPSDFKSVSSNGFDSFVYDQFGFDYNEPSQLPRRLSRIYNFAVAVTDGVHIVTRIFKIYVVTEEFLKADNNIVQVGTNVFTADSASDRVPIWITQSDLGRFRADNYVTIFLEVFKPATLPGSIIYIAKTLNPDGSPSQIPPGLEFDTVTGQLAGYVPYQTRISNSYTFTVDAVYYPAGIFVDSVNFKESWDPFVNYEKDDVIVYNDFFYTCIRANFNRNPDNEEFWIRNSTFTEKTFTVELFGDIDSNVVWISDSNLGSVKPNLPSELAVFATTATEGRTVVYNLKSGNLPSGLQFLSNGLINGKVKQFADDAGPGLTRLFESIDSSRDFNIVYDGGQTTFDRRFNLVIEARDVANFAKSEKEFFFTVDTASDKTFANLYIKPLQKKQKRLEWNSFITNVNIFPPEELYRYGDVNFAAQPDLKMLVFAGIESTDAVKYVQAMGQNHYRKRMLFGDVKLAKARDPQTQETIYEAIYVDMVDELEKNGRSISKIVELPNNINSPVLVSYDAIKIDSNTPLVSDRDHQRIFPNSIKNMRKNIEQVGERNREYLPLWMRSIQDFDNFESGYVRSVVLCYAKPGLGEKIIARIRASNFDFKTIDFVADRYLIDVIDGTIQDKYLAFPQRGEKLP